MNRPDQTTATLRAAYARAYRIRYGGFSVRISQSFPYEVRVNGLLAGALADCTSTGDASTGNVVVSHRGSVVAKIHAPNIAKGKVRP